MSLFPLFHKPHIKTIRRTNGTQGFQGGVTLPCFNSLERIMADFSNPGSVFPSVHPHNAPHHTGRFSKSKGTILNAGIELLAHFFKFITFKSFQFSPPLSRTKGVVHFMACCFKAVCQLIDVVRAPSNNFLIYPTGLHHFRKCLNFIERIMQKSTERLSCK